MRHAFDNSVSGFFTIHHSTLKGRARNFDQWTFISHSASFPIWSFGAYNKHAWAIPDLAGAVNLKTPPE
jgi:hypothetical protein